MARPDKNNLISEHRWGEVVETRGRRVLVRDAEGDRVCFLSGQRAVVGDEVGWELAPGSGGKLRQVLPRRNALTRTDARGKDQVLASNLSGIVIVCSVDQPPFRPGLLDRYLVAARVAVIQGIVCMNKVDLGMTPEVEAGMSLRKRYGVTIFETSATEGLGGQALFDYIAAHSEAGAWALVGHSGVGKTSLIQAMLPNADVGIVKEVSEYWGTGTHSTTHSRLFTLPGGGRIVDSPGIRTFLPGGLSPESVRQHFLGMEALQCQFRNCLHRPDEAGCVAENILDGALLQSYRRVLDEVVSVQKRVERRR